MVKTILALLSQMFAFATKVTPSDKIREKHQDIVTPKLEMGVFVAIYNKEYIRLRNHPEIDIKTDVNFTLQHSMPIEQEEQLIQLLTDRITSYRLRHKIIFRKWLKTQNLI